MAGFQHHWFCSTNPYLLSLLLVKVDIVCPVHILRVKAVCDLQSERCYPAGWFGREEKSATLIHNTVICLAASMGHPVTVGIGNHRITEYAEVERTREDHGVQYPALHSIIPNNHTLCLRALSKCTLNSVRLLL